MITKLRKQLGYLEADQKKLVEQALSFASEKHKDQKRRSGEPYINHPIRVAIFLAKSRYDAAVIAASLLHDTIEDTNTTFEELVEVFGEEVAALVDGVTKISNIKIKSKERMFSDEDMFVNQVENYRKLLVATAHDLRVIAIRLHDRLDNVMTIEYISKHKIKFYARETIEIFAPIADRLGMGEVKGALEDYAFKYAYPVEYNQFIDETKEVYKNPNKIVKRVIPKIKAHLQENNIKFMNISGRAKHLYSLYLKLKKTNDISQIFDIVALRVIVESVEDCYKTLGTIHSLFSPLTGRIYDYIARPKDSGYQSLHTTVKDSDGNIFEIQIRTSDMHEYAEYGPAAHWRYKDLEVGGGNKTIKSNNEWVSELGKIGNNYDGKFFIKAIKEELFSERIFVFSPRGDIIDLPQGSTSLDFAYKIHTELGNRCSGTKINNRLMPLGTALETKDVVEIITNSKSTPKRSWLQIAKTSYAKTKIKNYLRNTNKELFYKEGIKLFEHFLQENGQTEPSLVNADKLVSRSRLPYQDYKSALIAIGEGSISKTSLLKALYPNLKHDYKQVASKNTQIIEIPALKDIRHALAGCCKPKISDRRVGYLTREHIIKIHKFDCKRISAADPRRIFDLT